MRWQEAQRHPPQSLHVTPESCSTAARSEVDEPIRSFMDFRGTADVSALVIRRSDSLRGRDVEAASASGTADDGSSTYSLSVRLADGFRSIGREIGLQATLQLQISRVYTAKRSFSETRNPS